MADLLEHLESIYGGQYTMQRLDIQDAKRLTIVHLEQVVTIDLFNSGRPKVGGTNCQLKEEIKKHVEEFRKDPMYFEKRLKEFGAAAAVTTPEEAIGKIIKKGCLFSCQPTIDKHSSLRIR